MTNQQFDSKAWEFRALTDIWTGDADGQPDHLIPTGLLGSIRWWFEVLVRGLGGKACDPTSPVRCPDSEVKDPTQPGHHCVVCELFGCTGWARKFRFMVVDSHGNVIQKQIRANTNFFLRLIPLRPIREEEWCLLDLTFRLIADCGAIGGKTVLKPSDEPNKQKALHHRDFGLIEYRSGPPGWNCRKSRDELESHILDNRWRKPPHGYRDEQGQTHDFSWASLHNFWCVKGRYLARQDANKSTFNQVIGRKQQKSQAQQLEQSNNVNCWLAGRQQESKKVFSFRHPKEGGRTFGFVKPDIVNFDEIKRRLGQVWRGFDPDREFITGGAILQKLCKHARSLDGGTP